MRGRLRLRLRMARATVRRSGSRAALAIGAVGLGVAAATLNLALAAGAERELEAVAARVGRDLLIVSAKPVAALPGRGRGWYVSSRLDRDDVTALAVRAPELDAVAPMLEASRRVVLGRQAMTTTVRGVPPEYLGLRRFEIAAGRALDLRDERERHRVALLGASVARRLGGGADLVGRAVRVNGVPFEVVGVLAEKGMSPDGQNEDDQVLVPLETARRRLFNRESLSRLVVQAASADAVPAAERAVRAVLRETHRLNAASGDDFEIVPLVRTSEIRRRSSTFLRGMSALFAGSTLALGGAGVLAVSFLNVRDRTAEIGLRMAVGARRRDIGRLVVLESCLLAGLGGLAGLTVGLVAVGVLERTVGWRMAVDLAGVLRPFALALALGVVSGFLPARRAARVAPIAALRDA